MDVLQPITSFTALVVCLYVVKLAQRNRWSAYLLLAMSAFLAFQSLSYVDLLPIESARVIAFMARVIVLCIVTWLAIRWRLNPEAA